MNKENDATNASIDIEMNYNSKHEEVSRMKLNENDDENKIQIPKKVSTNGTTSSLNLIGSSVNLLAEQFKKVPTLDIPAKVKIPQQPPLGQRKILEFILICFGANLLAMNAGFINVVTLEKSGAVVSHVTGTLTKSAYNLEQNDMKAFDTLWCVPCFVCGSFFSSMLLNYQTFYLGRAYNRVFFMGSLMLAAAAILAIYDGDSMRYVYLTAVAMGMQNSMTTEYSGGVLRTTHCTGTATDIGIVLARVIKGRQGESWKLFVLIPLMCSFFLGGYIGALVFDAAPHFALFTNVIFFGGTGVLYAFYLAIYRHAGFFQTLFCTNDLENIIDPAGARTRAESIAREDIDEDLYHDPNEVEGINVETEEHFAKQIGFVSHFIHEDPQPITRRTSSRRNEAPTPASRIESYKSESLEPEQSIPASRINSRRSQLDDEPLPVTRRVSSRKAESVECFTPYDL